MIDSRVLVLGTVKQLPLADNSVHYAWQICNGRDISKKGLYLKDLAFAEVASRLC